MRYLHIKSLMSTEIKTPNQYASTNKNWNSASFITMDDICPGQKSSSIMDSKADLVEKRFVRKTFGLGYPLALKSTKTFHLCRPLINPLFSTVFTQPIIISIIYKTDVPRTSQKTVAFQERVEKTSRYIFKWFPLSPAFYSHHQIWISSSRVNSTGAADHTNLG